jgi:ADP-ribosylglycohydrolase
MLGAIIGDIVGSRWEFNPTNDYNFELFSDKNGFTDDTICTIAVADAILHHSDDYGKYIHEWCRKYPCPMGGYGGRFAQWVKSDKPEPYGSYGNGSAMRVSPVAWAFHKKDIVLNAAKQTAECTHNHPEGIIGAQTVALAVCRALQLRRLNLKAHDVVRSVITECLDYSGYSIDIHKKDVENKFDETCQGTVPIALWIISQSTGFEDAIRRAVSLGADADTLGAIVGSIAEAIWGIPEEIRERVMSYLPEEIKIIIDNFREKCKKLMKSIKIPQDYKPTVDEVKKYIKRWNGPENEVGKNKEMALKKLFEELCPENRDFNDILIKCSTLNDFYSANIFDVHSVALRIMKLNIDERLKQGDYKLVKDIAEVKVGKSRKPRNFYSFATKYCSHHRPEMYAIYDSYVDKLLWEFQKRDKFSAFKLTDLKKYPEFMRVIHDFQRRYGLEEFTVKELDQYLWQLGKQTYSQYE